MTTLHLHFNMLPDDTGPHLACLSALRCLRLTEEKLPRAAVSHFSALTSLEALGLIATALPADATAGLLEALAAGSSTRLTSLVLPGNQFTSQGAAKLVGLEGLQFLCLGFGNRDRTLPLTDDTAFALARFLAQLPRLDTLVLDMASGSPRLGDEAGKAIDACLSNIKTVKVLTESCVQDHLELLVGTSMTSRLDVADFVGV
jgi:hypothetical protein